MEEQPSQETQRLNRVNEFGSTAVMIGTGTACIQAQNFIDRHLAKENILEELRKIETKQGTKEGIATAQQAETAVEEKLAPDVTGNILAGSSSLAIIALGIFVKLRARKALKTDKAANEG